MHTLLLNSPPETSSSTESKNKAMITKISFGLPQKKSMDPTFLSTTMAKLPDMEEELTSYPRKYLHHANILDNILPNHSMMQKI